MTRISWSAIIAGLLALAGCILAGANESWDVLAVTLGLFGVVMALLSMRE